MKGRAGICIVAGRLILLTLGSMPGEHHQRKGPCHHMLQKVGYNYQEFSSSVYRFPGHHAPIMCM